MQDQAVIHSTFVIERSFPTRPENVFSAFADAAKKRRWFVEGENKEVDEFDIDFRVGGHERSRYHYRESSPLKGMSFTNEGSYQDIVPNRRIVSASSMTLGGNRISAALVTIELLTNDGGTDLIFTHQGVFFEGSDGPQIREAGWRKLLERLASELTN